MVTCMLQKKFWNWIVPQGVRSWSLSSLVSEYTSHCHQKPWAPSESALQDSISSLTSTALHDKGGPHWRRFENEVRTVSLRRRIHRASQKNTVTLLISSGKQKGCAKTDPENPGTRRNFVISSRFLSELFFMWIQYHFKTNPCQLDSVSFCEAWQMHPLSFLVDLKLTGVWATGAEPAGYS